MRKLKIAAWLLLLTPLAPAQEAESLPGSEECAMCHEPARITGQREEGVPTFPG